MKQRRFLMLSDDEIYILKRALIESSGQIALSGFYDDLEIKMHGNLLNEIVDEIKYRDEGKSINE